MKFGNYRFCCRFESDAHLPPYKGSTFRGVFGHALKDVVCALKRAECTDCLLRERCVYARVFETALAVSLPEGSRVAAPPHPFVIEPPLIDKTLFIKGDEFDFSLLLFGEANDYLPYFIYAFERMGAIGIGRRINGRRGKFRLVSVDCNGQPIYSDTTRKLQPPNHIAPLQLRKPTGKPAPEQVQIELTTPLRFKFNKRLVSSLPFHILVRAMLRRISSLLVSYGDGDPPLDYSGLVKRAESIRIAESSLHWHDWDRYSQRQKQKMQMGGLVGSIIYEGDLAEYVPLIEFCERVHLGKQTAFGLGKIGIMEEE